ncbi:MAG: bifunctional (p)ppGpp synthetase/guanosine-3',5'-bis(diphosphate) 3'-pyrophosphohydrolase [Proteobacteria bacterium]|nr:bifunctional (p)ppGpp synthetase/guanosine-3',5'-bis(diphosphate) 3'-pyrophosphohydrolase [Pseudomonadota bacterium]
MIRQYELVEKVRAYDPDADEKLLDRAYVFSMKAHGTQKRASGDPYFSHPLEVAGILTDMRLDDATIVTGLLHDTIEDTIATRAEIQSLFGDEVAQLVDGVTKLSQLELSSVGSKQAENFRKFVLAMSNDIRVLLVKLADRLHNMRTLHFIENPDKRHRIALETMEIYAPLAERIGMQAMKTELEDLAFLHLNADARESIVMRLNFLNQSDENIEEKISNKIHAILDAAGIEATVFGRQKQPYSIWRKMQKDNVNFEQLSDVMAFRVIVSSVEECYRALGVVHAHWRALSGRFRDYISSAKPNGYQSLHTTVIGPGGQRLEVQIRTTQMHRIAAYGVAAHWQYKQQVDKVDGTQFRWLRELMEMLEDAESPEEFLENTKIEFYSNQVFCFTPKGDLITLPQGATPIDFAYAVHTDVGNTCVGAKVNGKLAPLTVELNNGDQVDIVRSNAQTPPAAWEGMVASGRARSAIRRFLRNRGQSEYIELGQRLVERAFARAGYDLQDQSLELARRALAQKSAELLYAEVGKGNIAARDVLEAEVPGEKHGQTYKSLPVANGEYTIPVKGVNPGTAMKLGTCCHPLPGDRIVGLVTPGEGVIIHTIDCETLGSVSEDPDVWVDLSWEKGAADRSYHLSSIQVLATNEPGVLGKIATLVGKSHGNITNLKLGERGLQVFTILIDIEVQDVKHLTDILAALRTLTVVESVERLRG